MFCPSQGLKFVTLVPKVKPVLAERKETLHLQFFLMVSQL